MLVNYHCHSSCSPDCDVPMAEMAQAACAAGVQQVCFTDHCDALDGYGSFSDSFSWEDEERAFAEAVRATEGKLDLRLGVELGEAVQYPDYAAQILSHPHIDFVIGSVHNPVHAMDYYFQRYESREACLQLISDYLDQLLALAKTDFYDVIGHITYPLRYMRVRDGIDVDFRSHDEQVRELLRTVIAQGRGIELNTSGYVNCGGEPMPPDYILRQYRELGGEIVTIGSDAHVPENMALHLADGCALLREVGFRYLTVFQNRKPEFITL
jgi:histidinol-phosphatase (PHP family)